MNNLRLATSNVATRCGRLAKKHAPTILSVMSGVLSAAAILLAIEDTKLAIDKLKEAREEKGEDLTFWEKTKVAAPCYVDAALAESASLLCLRASRKISDTRIAKLATAYSVTEEAYRNYRQHVKDEIGERKVEKIEEKIAVDKAKNKQISEADIIETGYGDDLIMDGFTGHVFRGSIERVKQSFNTLEANLLKHEDVRICDLYDLMDIRKRHRGFVEEVMGWELEKCNNRRGANERLIDYKTGSTNILVNGLEKSVWVFTYKPMLMEDLDGYDWRYWY